MHTSAYIRAYRPYLDCLTLHGPIQLNHLRRLLVSRRVVYSVGNHKMNTYLTEQYLSNCYSAKTVLKFRDASRGFDHQLAYWVDMWLHGSPYSDENIMFMKKCVEEIKSGNVTSEEAKYLKRCAEVSAWHCI